MFAKNIIDYNGGTFKIRVRTMASQGNVVFTRELVTLNRWHDPERSRETYICTMSTGQVQVRVQKPWRHVIMNL
jgi:hypothetical protein